MRRHGAVEDGKGLGAQAHVCWCYEDRDAFIGVVGRFLADGLALGQRVVYVGEGSPGELIAELVALGDVDRLVASGALVVCPLEAFCDPDVGVVVDQQLAFCDGQLRQAIVDGFTGVRFAADVTRLAAPPLSYVDHVRWEQLADAYMDGHGLAALCGYDRRVIGAAAAAALTCVHPLRFESATTFGLFTLDGHLYLEGELDAFQAVHLARVLPSAPIDATHAVLDVAGLDFADCASAGVVAEFVVDLREKGQHLALRGAPEHFARLWDLLGFSALASLDTPASPARHVASVGSAS